MDARHAIDQNASPMFLRSPTPASGRTHAQRLRHLVFAGLALSGLAGAPASAETLFTIPGNAGGSDIDIFLTSGVATTATITNADGSFNTTVPIPANGTAIVTIPDSGRIGPLGTASVNGYSIDAPDPFAAYLMDANVPVASNDITNLFPDTSLGTNYLVMAATSSLVLDGSQIAVVAGTNGTTVTITPSAPLTTGQPAGVPFDVMLNRLEAIEFRASGTGDLTGTTISSTQPVAAFGGHWCANVPDDVVACDHVIEQLPATSDFGTQFVLVPTEQPGPGDVVKILARDDGTVVTFQDSGGTTVQPTLNAGEFLTLPPQLVENTRLTSNHPILLGQFMLGAGLAGEGDPAFALVPPQDQWLDRYIFNVPAGDYNDFLGIAIENAALASLKLDGVAVNPASFFSVPGTTLMAGNISVGDGSHVIEANGDFMLLGHGFNSNFASYFGVGGSSISGGGVTPPPPPPPSTDTPVPTLSPWALAVLGGMIGLLAATRLRRRAS